MANRAWAGIGKGFDKIRNNPQLAYTIVVAVLVAGAFVFMAERFVGIANDAQERLVNVRIGSLQDAFVSFAGERLSDPAYLNERIADVVAANETIQSFRILSKSATTTGSGSRASVYLVLASNERKEIGLSDPQAEFLYSLASSDPSHSFTLELEEEGGRVFDTARAIADDSGDVVAVAMTKQTLSQADKAIQDNIRSSIGILVIVIIVIMLLFLRHSRIIDYVALYRKLKEVDQLKDDFISMASHELRTPLSVIRGYAEFIREAPDLSPSTKDYATKIDLSAKDLDSLVGDILDVSRIEQSRMAFKAEKMDPSGMVSDIVSSFEIPAKDKGLAISYEGKAQGQSISADKDRLRQVIVNVVGNAVKYTKQGSVKVSQYVENGRVFIRVSDTGVGISSEERQRLFEKFYRIRNKDTEDIKGTGLGLWITAQITAKMGGSIEVESIKGVGSHFIISFPIAV